MNEIDLVTGGAGFIGRHVVAALRQAGRRVRVLDVHAHRAAAGDVETIAGSVLDPAALRAAAAGVRHVYHLAALAHLWMRDKRDYMRVNVAGTQAVLDAAAAAGAAKVIVTSSETVLRGWNHASATPIRESEPVPELSAMAGAYDRSKWLADQAARTAAANGLPVVILYPTVPVGPGDSNCTAPTRMIDAFLHGRMPAYYDCLLNLVPVEDVARGHLLAADKAAPGSRYILAGENLWMHDILAMLAALTGRPVPRRRIPYWLAALSGGVSEWWADHVTRRPPLATLTGVRLARHPRFVDATSAARALGFAPGSVRDALARAVAWLQAHPHRRPS